MASPTVLTFDAVGRAVDFEFWVDDLQLFLQCDSKDRVSLFDHTSGVAVAPAADANSTIRSQWTTRDAAARLAVRSHLPSAERADFSQYKTARTLYDAVVVRYSSPATAALSRLILPRPAAVSLADPFGGPVLAHSSTVLPCPAVPSGSWSSLHLPSFSTNLVSGADLQDAWVDQFTPGGQRVTHCSCTRTGRHLATFTRQPGSSLYTLTTVPPPLAEPGQVAASGQVFATASRSGPESNPCSCHLLSHQTLLWHHCLGHPSLPRLRGMASLILVTGLPRSLPPLPPGTAPTCVSCVEGQQRAAPHSSEFPPTEAPLHTLHMDVWGPDHVRGQGNKRYFLLVVDDYSRYTTIFPLRRKGGEFSSDLLRAFCRAEGIRQTFTLPASPPQNGIAECRIGMVMDVTHKLSSHAVPCVFLGFPPDASCWLFYHPTSRRVLSSQDVTFDESVPYYHAVEPVEVAVESSAARGAEPVGAGSGGTEPERAEPGGAESGGAEPGVAESGGAEPGVAESGGAEPTRVESGGATPGGPS
ncbi:unnamed protein product, partial [Closterium sp. NIES-53]